MFKSLEDRLPIKQMIASQIEEAILNKKFEPGSKLPSENELCVQFGVSRTSVREAIQMLSAQGLVYIEKGRGIFVSKVTSESVVSPLQKYLKLKIDKNYVVDLTHARQILEPAIAKEASLNHDEDDLQRLENDIELLINCKGGYIELANIDMSFHLNLAKATKNIVVPLLLKPIHSLIPEIKSTVYATVKDAKDSATIWHRKILDAVKRRDGESAYEAMVEHLKIAEEHAKKVFVEE
ncbi:MAG: FadR family transcriptional regulator [Melioribacteraceae bacterium]|nr:FadR family transcriptional regulator [Melioribacteraceae bacterium]